VELGYDRLDELRERFVVACAARVSVAARAPDGNDAPCLKLLADDDPAKLFRDMMLLEPCGQQNPRPRVGLEAQVVRARAVRGGHLKLELESACGRRLAAFGIDMGDRAEALSGLVNVAGELRPDRWRGGDAVELRLDQLEPG
jgi:single-stranded-DNA-specific exonuclease